MNQCEFGKSGEDFAELELIKEGFKILTRNFRIKIGEIDLIAIKNQRLHFFEIKTYQTNLVAPEQRITPEKILRMQRVAQLYLNWNFKNQELGCCFELIKVQINQSLGFERIVRVPIEL